MLRLSLQGCVHGASSKGLSGCCRVSVWFGAGSRLSVGLHPRHHTGDTPGIRPAAYGSKTNLHHDASGTAYPTAPFSGPSWLIERAGDERR